MLRNIALLFIAFSSLIVENSCKYTNANNSIEQALFLSEGKMCLYDVAKNNTGNFKLAGDSILSFILSPTKRYIAYEKFLRFVDSPGLYDSFPPKEALNSIVVYDLELNKVLIEISPESFEFINISRWISEDELLCSLSSGFSVDGWKIYKTNGSIENLGYSDRQKVLNSILFSKDGKKECFVDNRNNMHLVDMVNKNDHVIYNTSNFIADIEFSNDF